MKKSGKILAFISLAIACFLTVLDSTIVNVSLPNMASYFKSSMTEISWVSTAYLISFSALLINFSKIADIFGRKKLFLIGLFIFGVASICCGLANSLGMLIFFRIIQGIGAAILTPLSIPLGIELFGKNALGKLSVIIGMIISISAACGPVIGGILNEAFNFRAIFYVNIPFVIISFILGVLYVKECYDETIEKKIDFIGCILLAGGLGALTFLLVKGNDYGWGSSKIISLILVSVVSILGFLIYERRIKNPMIEFNLFKIRSFSASITLIAVVFSAYMPVSYLMNFYFERLLGYSVLKAGLMMGIPSLTAFLSSPIISIISKKVSPKVISFFSIILVATGNFLFVFMNKSNYMTIIITSFIILGLGIRTTTMLYQTAFEEVSKNKNGLASGILNSLRQVSACIAIALVATLSSHYTTIAVKNTKEKIVAQVNSASELDQNVKDSIISKVKTSQANNNTSFTKETVHNMIATQEKSVLANVPEKMKANVIAKFNTQEKAIDKIVSKAKSIKDTESYKVYNKCFLITAIIAVFGIIAVPFNSKRKPFEEESLEEAVS